MEVSIVKITNLRNVPGWKIQDISEEYGASHWSYSMDNKTVWVYFSQTIPEAATRFTVDLRERYPRLNLSLKRIIPHEKADSIAWYKHTPVFYSSDGRPLLSDVKGYDKEDEAAILELFTLKSSSTEVDLSENIIINPPVEPPDSN